MLVTRMMVMTVVIIMVLTRTSSRQIHFPDSVNQQCPESCSSNYDPVCGDHGITHVNRCMKQVSDCWYGSPSTILHDGPCEGPRHCTLICIHLHDPVCGSNNKTYSNLCYLFSSTCYDNPPVTLQHRGEC